MKLSLRRRRGRRSRRLHPLPIAVVVIGVALFGTFLAFNEGLPFVHGFTVHALVKNSVNVRPDTPVRIAGVDVGRVTSTEPDGNLTRVSFELKAQGLPVHSDATVQIRDRLFLEGGYYLALSPGSPDAPIAQNGFTIPPSGTGYPVQFYQVLSTFDQPVRTSLVHTLKELDRGFNPPAGEAPTTTNSGAGGLKATIPELSPTLRDVAWITRGLRGTHAGDIERLLSSAANVTSTLAGSSAQVGDLVTSLERTSGALAAADGAVAQSVAGLDETLRQAPASLSAIDRALPPLTNLAVALDPSLRAAPPILQAVVSAVRQLGAVVAPAERTQLLASLKTTFETFPTTLTQLGSVFPITQGVTDCLRTHVTPILKSVIGDGSLSSDRPVWQDFTHLVEGLSNAVQNFDGNGYWIRVIGGGGPNGISVGQLPGLGSVLGSSPGSSAIQGSRPQWVGDLTSADFRPDVPCRSQPVPSLAAAAAAPDLHGGTRGATPSAADVAAAARALSGSHGSGASR